MHVHICAQEGRRVHRRALFLRAGTCAGVLDTDGHTYPVLTRVRARVRVPCWHPCVDVFVHRLTWLCVWPKATPTCCTDRAAWQVGARGAGGSPASPIACFPPGGPRGRSVGPCAQALGRTAGPLGRARLAGCQPRARRGLVAGPACVRAAIPLGPHRELVCLPGGMSVSQCSKEDGRSSSGPSHETAAPKRTYDMMEGRVSRAIASAGIEGGCAAQALPWVVTVKRGVVWHLPGGGGGVASPMSWTGTPRLGLSEALSGGSTGRRRCVPCLPGGSCATSTVVMEGPTARGAG